MKRDTAEEEAAKAAEPAESAENEQDPAATAEADHELVMATARRIIADDAAIIYRLGTI